MFARRRNPSDRSRRGAVSVEALFAVALVMTVVLGAVGVADLLIAEQSLAEASGRAARVAALGGTEGEIAAAAAAVLGPARAGHAKITVGTPAGSGTAAAAGGMVEVRVEVEARHATLTPFAPVSGGEKLLGRTVM